MDLLLGPGVSHPLTPINQHHPTQSQSSLLSNHTFISSSPQLFKVCTIIIPFVQMVRLATVSVLISCYFTFILFQGRRNDENNELALISDIIYFIMQAIEENTALFPLNFKYVSLEIKLFNKFWTTSI